MGGWLKQRLWPALKATWAGWGKHDGALMSAAMAFSAAFSLFPLLLVLISIVGFGLRFSTNAQFQQQQLVELIAKNVSPWLAEQFQQLMAGVANHAGVGGPLGIAALIIAAISIFTQLNAMFDRIWDVPAGQGGWWAMLRDALYGRLSAFVMLVVVGVLLVAVFVADTVLTGVQEHVAQLPGGGLAGGMARGVFPTALNTLLFGLIYKTLPRARVRWRDALLGGLLVALVWKAGQAALASLVIGEHYSVYGVVGSFIAIMLWIYYSSILLFLGAEFVRALQRD